MPNAALNPLIFLSTPSGWRATAEICAMLLWALHISIHALRVEGDLTEEAEEAEK